MGLHLRKVEFYCEGWSNIERLNLLIVTLMNAYRYTLGLWPADLISERYLEAGSAVQNLVAGKGFAKTDACVGNIRQPHSCFLQCQHTF